ncbi:uncharacterized protein [Haliaeetus albicilla]|uniref:uncharacterized protein n=1 Tax=Haliaeetus albicilla TaxID=8969 RepID=UPI0037E753F3
MAPVPLDHLEQGKAPQHPKKNRVVDPGQFLAGDGGHRAARTAKLLLEPKAPGEPALVADPHLARQDRQAACSNISLFSLLQRRRWWEKLSSEEMLQQDFWLQELQGTAGLAGEGRATRDQEPGAKKGLPTRQRRKLSRCRKTPSAASCPGPGLPQCHGVQPGEGAGESRAANSIWRAKSMHWRSSWTNDCLDEELASTRSPPGPSKVPAGLDIM